MHIDDLPKLMANSGIDCFIGKISLILCFRLMINAAWPLVSYHSKNYHRSVIIIAVYMKSLATTAKVTPVNLIYGNHFSTTGAIYVVSQNMENFAESLYIQR